MKILVLQLARLGDIYLSWPAFRALRRSHPEAQIHVLTRPRFAGALEGLKEVNEVKLFSTKQILAPLIQDQPNVTGAFQELSQSVDALKSEGYDWIINFSFSPASSYLVHAISHEHSKVSGYTRYEDGFLKIPDDISAYFYAQVGVGRANRFHLSEIFATMVETDLCEEDWLPPDLKNAWTKQVLPNTITIHIGASEQKKALSASKWISILSQLRKQCSNPLILIGAPHEIEIGEKIMTAVPGGNVFNMVGRTNLIEVFQILSQSSLLVGCDSAPMHMASLTKTPSLNLSFSTVNFWETGPRAPHSYILKGESEDDFVSDKVAAVAHKILHGEKLDLSVVVGQKGNPSYRAFTRKDQDEQWNMVQAIYQGLPFPAIEAPLFDSGIVKLMEVNQLMLEQMTYIQKGGDLQKVSGIIDRGEEIIQTISNLVPPLGTLIRWYQTEKIRIGPGTQEEVLAKTIHIHNLLKQVLEIYGATELEAVEAR
jgi:heptosyltransferase-3